VATAASAAMRTKFFMLYSPLGFQNMAGWPWLTIPVSTQLTLTAYGFAQ
jgi:hypothetical protein